jgi:hypothetical protein
MTRLFEDLRYALRLLRKILHVVVAEEQLKKLMADVHA